MKDSPEISVIIPAKNEESSLPILYQELTLSLKKTGKTFEIIIIDDGSTDDTLQIAKRLHDKDNRVKVIKLRGWCGKSAALQAGFDKAQGKMVFTMDADLQDDPKEIQNFLDKLEEGYDLVSGWKKVRHDPFSKKLPSKIGNSITRLLTGIKIHDLNCGFKAYRREVYKSLYLYGELYKYIPVLAEKQNFKVGEIVVSHRARKFGKSKFGWERNIKGFLDMLTVVFLTTYTRKPAHFFGGIGLAFFSIGFVIGIYITYLRITTGGIQYRQPLLFLGILLIIIGIQLITTGLLAEMLVNLSQKKTPSQKYISEVID